VILGERDDASRSQLAELRATGQVHSRSAVAAQALTPQEYEIAQLAAAGLTNKQIAEHVLVSPRTVGTVSTCIGFFRSSTSHRELA
jgi:DNA-binding NarL/FixJ family response regulator